MPAVLLGFHPSDSCVVMGLSGPTVAFCARLDLDWFVTHFDQVADQILHASAQVPDCRFVLIGFGDPDLASLAVVEMSGVVGESRVLESLVTDGERYWCLDEDLETHEFQVGTSSLAAQAVYEGLRICADREQAVAPVELSEPLPPAEQEAGAALVASLSPDEGMARLAELAESADPLQPAEAQTLALLLLDEDRMGAVLARLSVASADLLWENLVAARRVAPPSAEPNVLALLGMASWLSGRGAAQTSCLEQVERIHPEHPVGALLSRIHRYGIPPRRWDE